MKSMKFLMTIMLVALCVSFASCSSKDEPQDRGIIGEWSYYQKSSGIESRCVFNADGTSTVTLYSGGVPGPKDNYTYTYDSSTSTGRLTSVNNSFTAMFKYEAGVINVYSTSGKILETYSRYVPLSKN